MEYQREVFEKYAMQHQFDHLNPINWYTQSKGEIMTMKVFFLFLKSHKRLKTSCIGDEEDIATI